MDDIVLHTGKPLVCPAENWWVYQWGDSRRRLGGQEHTTGE